MKKHKLFSVVNNIFILLLLVSFGISCSNSTSSEEEIHSEPEGFVLKMNGQDIVTQVPGGTVSGEFELEPGVETDLITIWFYDADGDEFQPEEDAYSLGYEFADTGIAEFEQHTEDGKWSFHIHAEAEGITELRLMLMHSGHSDFSTQDIHVHVEAAE